MTGKTHSVTWPREPDLAAGIDGDLGALAFKRRAVEVLDPGAAQLDQPRARREPQAATFGGADRHAIEHLASGAVVNAAGAGARQPGRARDSLPGRARKS
jgi:hypothetical protein